MCLQLGGRALRMEDNNPLIGSSNEKTGVETMSELV